MRSAPGSKLGRLLLCLVAIPVAACALGSEAGVIQAVEFPFGRFPRALWERELVWLKNIGIRQIAFSIPPSSRTSDPRHDVAAFLDLLQTLDLQAWIRAAPGQAAPLLERYSAARGGPVAIWEGGPDCLRPPPHVAVISALDPEALSKIHRALAQPGMALLWTGVEDAFEPALQAGAVSVEGVEAAGARLLRRHSSLVRQWGRFFSSAPERRYLPGRPGPLQILSREGWSLLRVDRASSRTGAGELRAFDVTAGKYLKLPAVPLPAGDSLWLPVHWPLTAPGLCEDSRVFHPKDRIVYATAELHAVEWENGILAFEFYAPVDGEIVLQLAAKPAGPYLAAGRPVDFDWDAAQSAVRLPVPAGKAPAYRVRVGLALRAPEQTAFFTPPPRLLLGRANRLAVTASSPELAANLRLAAPAGWTVAPAGVRDQVAEFDVTPPERARHGEFVWLILEHGETHLGHARVQTLEPARLRVADALTWHSGDRRLPLDPPVVLYEPRAGRRVSLLLRNHQAEIANFTVRAEAEGIEVDPPEQAAPVGPGVEREVPVRLSGGGAGPHRVRIRVRGAAELDRELLAVPLRRGQTIAYRADFDGDGTPDAAVENGQVRAVFSGADGRWLELIWKDTDASLLAEAGQLTSLHAPGVDLQAAGPESVIHFRSGTGRRTVRLSADGCLSIEEDQPWRLPSFSPLPPGLELEVGRPAPARVDFTLRLQATSPEAGLIK